MRNKLIGLVPMYRQRASLVELPAGIVVMYGDALVRRIAQGRDYAASQQGVQAANCNQDFVSILQ
ncbi:hypothetical protein [Vogesella sp. LIG4]|uniref:hypothetical protein n=1 Tax=Vogesella sp. LIG4 TaxID=1192162 RepID=UPI0012FE15ED|nr:hypothetical protein [Vogesella sp. LIG4]